MSSGSRASLSNVRGRTRGVDDDRSGSRGAAELVAKITDDQLGSRTPCPDYTLGDLLDHVNGLAQAFTDAAKKVNLGEPGVEPQPGSAANLDRDWRTVIPQRLAALGEAWRDLSAWEGMTRAGGIDLPGEIAGIVALDEVIVHGWDIAKASGQPYDADADHVEVCLETMSPQPGEERPEGPDVPFGRPVDVSSGAPPIDRLVAALGRDPSWSPSR